MVTLAYFIIILYMLSFYFENYLKIYATYQEEVQKVNVYRQSPQFISYILYREFLFNDGLYHNTNTLF